jgi:hypothetical protein
LLEFLFKAVEHSSALFVTSSKVAIHVLVDIFFRFRYEEMMDGFTYLTACSVDTFDLVADMAIVILLANWAGALLLDLRTCEPNSYFSSLGHR